MTDEEDRGDVDQGGRRGDTRARCARLDDGRDRRHTGRDRKTIQKYLARPVGEPGRGRAPSCLEPFRGYVEARFVDDPHIDATVLHRELAAARV